MFILAFIRAYESITRLNYTKEVHVWFKLQNFIVSASEVRFSSETVCFSLFRLCIEFRVLRNLQLCKLAIRAEVDF